MVLLAIEDINEHTKAVKELQESKDELQELFKSMINAFVIFESVFDDNSRFISCRFVYINDAYERITGVKNDGVKGKTIHEVWPETESKWIKKYGEVAVTGVPQTFEMYHAPTGKLYYCNVYRPRQTSKRFCVIFEDITDRKQAEEEKEDKANELKKKIQELAFQNKEKEKRATELNENKTLLASVLDSSLSGIMAFKSIRNAEGAIMDFEWQLINAAAEQMVSRSQTEIVGKRLLEEMPGNRSEGLFDLYVRVVETGIPLDHEHYYEHEKVKTWFHTVAIKRLDGFVVTFSNITNRKLTEQELLIANKELAYLGYHDFLTDLYNRTYFEEEKNRLDTARQLPISIIMVDINSLKLANDAFGHNVGDTILKETAALLKKICRSEDILARWGGDEFVILLPKTSITDSEEIVQRIKKECAKINIQKMPLSLSIGITTKTEAGQDIEIIIADAESNMYKNKLVEKESSASSIIFALEQALFEKSSETMEHALRIKDNSIKLGKSVNLASNQLDELSLLASLHDIGKVAIPESILLKEGRPTEEEWAVIKRHPEIGFNIAQSSPQINHLAKYILACHENWDGSGYPQGLVGDAIPIVSRIIFICDAYDVMTSERSYKKAMSKDDAIRELKRCAGTQFDSELVDKFIEIIST